MGWGHIAAALGIVVATGCGDSHDSSGAQAVRSEDCALCHNDAFDVNAIQAHTDIHADSRARAAACGQCHWTETWQPALGWPHTEDAFPVSVEPHSFACLDCHDLNRGADAAAGANTSCTGCHVGAHTQELAEGRHRRVTTYAFDGENPAFCLTCHPGGRNDPERYPPDTVIDESIP